MTCDDYKFKDFSVLIQGPINHISLKNLDKYSEYGPVVVSTWASEEITSTVKKQDVKFIINQLPDKKDNSLYIKDSTFYWAICSMYHGLKNVETKYVVKTRSDESFSELEPFIEPFLLDDKKMVCGNCFVQKFEKKQFHIGDHIFISKTKTLLDAVSTLRDIYNGKAEKHTWAQQGPYSAEQVLAFAFLNSNGVRVPTVINGQEQPGERDVFCENFHVVDVNEVSKFKLQWNHAYRTYNNSFVNHHGVTTMGDI